MIRTLRAEGLGIIYISHRLHEVFEIGDRVTVLRNGRLVATRDLHGLTVPDLVRMMIGRDIADEYSFDDAIVPGKVALSVAKLKRDAFENELKALQIELLKLQAHVLKAKEREEELARMLGGVELTREARAAAKRLLADVV